MNIRTSVLSSLLLSVGFIGGCQQQVEPPAASGQQAAAAAPQTTAQQPRVVDLVPAPAAATSAPSASMANGLATGAVVETMAAGGYTYALVDVGGEQIWAAGPPTAMAVGDTITFSTLIPMKDFHSSSLNRDFPVLYFVDGFSTLNSGITPAAPEAAADPAPATVASIADIEKVEGGYTIAEILAQRNELTTTPVKVRGQVTKVVSGIMGKNWVHLSDSSGDDDFIVTTDGTASVGQVIVAEGMIALNRDFGYGYKYDILLENAAITAE